MEPLETITDLRRREALIQAVAWANGQSHAVRKSSAEIVAAAVDFEAFLTPPEPDTPE